MAFSLYGEQLNARMQQPDFLTEYSICNDNNKSTYIT